MRNLTSIICLLSTFCLLNCSPDEPSIVQETPLELYYPPLDPNLDWETKSITDLDWNQNELQPLLNFLQEKNTKGFLMLHRGKIVEGTEVYMNGHTANALWYWASAGKTLTTAVSGIAQDEGFLDINSKVSDYLGTGWTSAPLEKENLITCKNLLSMNSGLDDGLGDNVSAQNLHYLADAGSRWAYHNVYVKLQDVIEEATNQSFETYFTDKLKNRIGMNGAWIPSNDFSVYFSNTRSMARFGLLVSAKGVWENDQIISEAFMTDATNTSQQINKAYGYLWWLNGKATYHLPQSQFEFQGELIPNAPSDMYCALGRDDQKLYIVPSKNLVIVRMGEAADGANFALSNFDNELWAYINALTN